MTYLTTLCLSHTLQAIEDLFDPKSCELLTLVENGMPSKPITSYTLMSHCMTMRVRDLHSVLVCLIQSKLQLTTLG